MQLSQVRQVSKQNLSKLMVEAISPLLGLGGKAVCNLPEYLFV